MALVRTTLTSKVGASDLLINVASTATGFPPVGLVTMPQQQMFIENELMFVVQVPVAGQVLVRSRGSDGTVAVAHDVNAPVVTSTTPGSVQDFPALRPGTSVINPQDEADVVTYGVDGAIVVPTKDTNVFLAGTAAIAMTLGAPSLASNGTRLVIEAQTGFAHTVTTPGVTASTGLLNTGTTGGPFTVATFNGVVGASVVLMALNGTWNVVGLAVGVTFT